MRVLFERSLSPFSRRVRMLLEFKGLAYTRRDAAVDPEAMNAGHLSSPLRTFPVLVEPNGVSIGDSDAIALYLDAAYPTPALIPQARAAQVARNVAWVNRWLNVVVDLGSRYHVARDHAGFVRAQREQVVRAQDGLDALCTNLPASVKNAGWSLDSIYLYSALLWWQGLPARAPQVEALRNILDLGIVVAPQLHAWQAEQAGAPLARAAES
jgi:glutathione S-transferase